MADLLSYLPNLYRDLKETKEIMQAEGVELDGLAAAIEQILSDKFIDTANVQAIQRRELQLGIRADASKETLEFRRKRLVNRYSTKPPFTERYLQSRLDALVGIGRAIVGVDVQNFVLKVTIDVPDASYFREIEYTIKSAKPANLSYNQATSLTGSMALEEHIWKTPLIRRTRLGQLSRNTKLGSTWKVGNTPLSERTGSETSWRLGKTPLAVRGQEVQIK